MTTTPTRGGLLAGVLCLALGTYWTAGPTGLTAAAIVGAVTLADRPPYDVAAAQVVVAALAGPATYGVILSEVGVLILFTTRLVEKVGPRWTSLGFGAGIAFAGLATAVTRAGETVGAAAAILLLIAGFTTYAAHRYERVTLGLAEGSA